LLNQPRSDFVVDLLFASALY